MSVKEEKNKNKNKKKFVEEKNKMTNNLKNLEQFLLKVRKDQNTYSQFSQEKVDEIFKQVAMALNKERISLAKMAVQETGMGIVEDKVIKNHFATEFIYNKYKNYKTCGIIEENIDAGIKKIAEPIGIIAGVIPTTNPTSTTIFKALLALKTRNAIIFSPHPRAKNCTIHTAKIILEIAKKFGAPENIIGWIDEPSLEMTQFLMQNCDLTLATGGPNMVLSAYSSGKPAIGVGPGNTPAVIDETADILMAVNSVILSKTFDNGVICASEQSVLVHKDIYQKVKDEFLYRGCYFLSEEEKQKLGKFILKENKLNANIVGQSANKIAQMAGISIDKPTKILIAEIDKVGDDEPFSVEKLSPILGMYKIKSFEEGVEKAENLVNFAGKGHTSVLYTNPLNSERINYFGNNLKTGRILINTPSSQGAIGDIFNFYLEPSLTLGCGSWGGNSVSENVGVKHLLNIKTIAQRRENMLWMQVPPKIYFKMGIIKEAFKDLKSKKRAFIVTDKFLSSTGIVKKITSVLDEMKIDYKIFDDVKPDPTIENINLGLKQLKEFEPDLIIAFGGGSPMDASKIMWLMYEKPDTNFQDLAMTFMDIRKRVYKSEIENKKAYFVAIPTTSGTGSEVTPFAVITDDKTKQKYPLADYALTPDMAILDADFVLDMPKTLTAYSGIDALTHSLEAYASMLASPYTDCMAKESMAIIFKYLPRSYKNGNQDLEAREQMHYGANLAGLAFANSFLGLCHSMAHKLGNAFGIAHGLANALLITEIIKYNATDCPQRQGIFAQYKYPNAKQRYAQIADFLGLGGKDVDQKIENLIKAIDELKEKVGIAQKFSIVKPEITKQEYEARIEELVEQAFNDQCTGANPVYPMMDDIRRIYKSIF